MRPSSGVSKEVSGEDPFKNKEVYDLIEFWLRHRIKVRNVSYIIDSPFQNSRVATGETPRNIHLPRCDVRPILVSLHTSHPLRLGVTTTFHPFDIHLGTPTPPPIGHASLHRSRGPVTTSIHGKVTEEGREDTSLQRLDKCNYEEPTVLNPHLYFGRMIFAEFYWLRS